jgi:hypothetical protein
VLFCDFILFVVVPQSEMSRKGEGKFTGKNGAGQQKKFVEI